MKFDYLFRGLSPEGVWVYGSLCLNPYDSADVEIIDHSEILLPRVSVRPETVEQWNGIVLEDGTRLFEGDIVTVCGRYPKLVLFDRKCAGFSLANVSDLMDRDYRRLAWQHPDAGWWRQMLTEIAVDGNIWETEKYRWVQDAVKEYFEDEEEDF